MKTNVIYHADSLQILTNLPDTSIDLVYIDPPFGTQKTQKLEQKRNGKIISKIEYCDTHEDYLAFLEPYLCQIRRVLNQHGTMYLHLDVHWSHYAKVVCDRVFGRENFLNDIVWSYNFGGRGKNRFPQKHDNILVYAREFGKHTFNWDKIDRIPYSAPEMQYVGRTKEDAEKRIAAGQVPTDVWSMSIVGTASRERTAYPTQKPVKLVKRCIVASSNEGDIVLDAFAGSGTTVAAAIESNRKFIACDVSQEAISVMKRRFIDCKNIQFIE